MQSTKSIFLNIGKAYWSIGFFDGLIKNISGPIIMISAK